MRPIERRRGWTRGSFRLASTVLTLSAVLLATFLGGRRYFYCRMMDEVMSPADCGCGAHADSQEQATIASSDDCLELRTLDRLHSFTVAIDWVVPSAGLVAILPVPLANSAPASAVAANLEHPIRAGPESPAAARARLMVFLT